MVWQVKTLAAMPENLSSISRTQMWVERAYSLTLSSDFHTCALVCVQNTHTNK